MYRVAFTLLVTGAMVSQVYTRSVLLVAFDSVNKDFITDKMPALNYGGDIGRYVARPNALKSENPTESFPTLHTVATGVLPSVHGVIADKMFDLNGDVMFNTPDQFNIDPQVIPIWTEAVKNGNKTATFMWPGANFATDGTKPHIFEEYKPEKPWGSRTTTIQGWFKNDGVNFGMAYFEDHDGTETVEDYYDRVQTAIQELYDGLNGLDVDIIILSNHGSKKVEKDHVLKLDDYLSVTDCKCKFIASGPNSFIRFNDSSDLERIYTALKEADLDGDGHADHGIKFKVYKRDEEDMTEWNLKDNDYLENTLFVATLEGYTFYDKDKFEALETKGVNIVREYGYKKSDLDMDGILLFHGPSFKDNVVTNDEIQLTEVYHLTRRLLGLCEGPSVNQIVESVSENMKKLIEDDTMRRFDKMDNAVSMRAIRARSRTRVGDTTT